MAAAESWKVQVLAWLVEWRDGIPHEAALALEELCGVGRIDAVGFARFWAIYPRKIGKGGAWNAWQKLRPGRELVVQILASVPAHQQHDPQWRDPQFIPHPQTYLNQRRFEDELTAAPQISAPTSRLAQAVADFSKLP